MKKSKSNSKIIKAQPTQEKVLKLLVYLLEAEGPVSMISLEKLYGEGMMWIRTSEEPYFAIWT